MWIFFLRFFLVKGHTIFSIRNRIQKNKVVNFQNFRMNRLTIRYKSIIWYNWNSISMFTSVCFHFFSYFQPLSHLLFLSVAFVIYGTLGKVRAIWFLDVNACVCSCVFHISLNFVWMVFTYNFFLCRFSFVVLPILFESYRQTP